MYQFFIVLNSNRHSDRGSKDVSSLIKRFSQDMSKIAGSGGISSISLPRNNRRSSIIRNQTIGGFDSQAYHLKVVPDNRSSSLSREV